MLRLIGKLLRNSKGATAIEYGLIAALVSVAAVAAWNTLGGSIRTTFTTVNTDLTPTAGG